MPFYDDKKILRKVPFLKNGMVIFVAGPSTDTQNLYVEQNRSTIQGQFSEVNYHFVFIPDLLESLPESVLDYFFPLMSRPSQDAIYEHIRKTARLGNEAGLLYQRGQAIFFRELNSDSCQEEIDGLVKELDSQNRIRYRMAPAEPEPEVGEPSLFENEVIYPAKHKKETREKKVSWIRKQTKKTADALEDIFDSTMGGLFDMESQDDTEECESIQLEEQIEAILSYVQKDITEKFGITLEQLGAIINYNVRLSHLHISRSGKMMLSDFGKEVKMDDKCKAFYFLYLRHPEGIRYKEMSDYREELLEIYWGLVDREREEAAKTIDRLIDPLGNEMNVCSSRIKAAFRNQVGERVAKFYYLVGPAGEIKKIPLDRDLVIWEH